MAEQNNIFVIKTFEIILGPQSRLSSARRGKEAEKGS
jgi:hypothetical protein